MPYKLLLALSKTRLLLLQRLYGTYLVTNTSAIKIGFKLFMIHISHDRSKRTYILIHILSLSENTWTGSPSNFLPQATVDSFSRTASATGETNFADGITRLWKNRKMMNLYISRMATKKEIISFATLSFVLVHLSGKLLIYNV